MIRLKINRRSNVLLYAEMIIALLFFVISFAVIIRVFASADNVERKSRQRQSAALCAQSIAEAYSVSGDVQRAVSLALGADLRDFSGSADIGLDSGFYPADSSEIILRLLEQREQTAAGEYSELTIEFYDNYNESEVKDEPVYSLKCGAYVSGGGVVIG